MGIETSLWMLGHPPGAPKPTEQQIQAFKAMFGTRLSLGAAAALDLVEVNGLWMTRDEAARGGHIQPRLPSK